VNIAAATADGESKLALGLFDNRWGDPDRWGCGVVPSAELAPSWESEETVEAADEAEIELPEERLDAVELLCSNFFNGVLIFGEGLTGEPTFW